MSPVHIPRGFTKAYINGEVVEDLGGPDPGRPPRARRAITTSLLDRGHRPCRGRRGHRPVERGRGRRCSGRRRSSSARAASAGRSTRSSSTRATSRATGSRSPGAIVNKVDLDAQPGLGRILERGLAPHGIPLLGVLPVPADPVEPDPGDGPRGRPRRDAPSRARTSTGSSTASRSGRWSRSTCSSGSGRARWSSSPATARTRSSRLTVGATPLGQPASPLGLVLTGGYRPSQTVIDEIRWADLFATLVAEDTYEVASEVHDLLVKTHPADLEKIALIKALVAERLDVDRILAVAR